MSSLFAEFVANPEAFYADEEAQPDWVSEDAADEVPAGDSDSECDAMDADDKELEAEDEAYHDADEPTYTAVLIPIFAAPDEQGAWQFTAPAVAAPREFDERCALRYLDAYHQPTARGVVRELLWAYRGALPAGFADAPDVRVYSAPGQYFQCARDDTTDGTGVGTLHTLNAIAYAEALAERRDAANSFYSYTSPTGRWGAFAESLDAENGTLHVPVFVTPGAVALPDTLPDREFVVTGDGDTARARAASPSPFFSIYDFHEAVVDQDNDQPLALPPNARYFPFTMPLVAFRV